MSGLGDECEWAGMMPMVLFLIYGCVCLCVCVCLSACQNYSDNMCVVTEADS